MGGLFPPGDRRVYAYRRANNRRQLLQNAMNLKQFVTWSS
jgi:hypothetical protein